MSNLLDLPQDVLLDITKYLDSKDVRGLREVNKSDLYPLIDTLQQTTLRRPDIFRPSFYETLINFNNSFENYGYFFVKTSFEKNNEIVKYPSDFQHTSLRNKPKYIHFMIDKIMYFYNPNESLKSFLKSTGILSFIYYEWENVIPQNKLFGWIDDDIDESFLYFIADKFKNYLLDSNHTKKRTLKISLKPFFLLYASTEYNNAEDARAFTMQEKDLIDNFKLVFNFYKVKNIEFE